MRRYAISTLFLVWVVMSGACAGRQAHTRFVQAPPRAETTASMPAPAPVAEPSVADPTTAAEPAPAVTATEEPKLTTQQQIDRYVADELAAHDAAVRAAAERMHRTPMPPNVAADAALVAALKIDASRVREADRRTAKEFAAMWRDFDVMVSRLEADAHAAKPKVAAARPRPKPKAERSTCDDGREAVAGTLALASPPVEAPAAPAAPSIVNAAPGTPNVLAAGTTTDRPARSAPESIEIFVPDRAAVEKSQAYWADYLAGAAFAAFIGILLGLAAAWTRARRIKALLANPYDHLPDGTVLMQEVVGGALVTKQVFRPDPPAPRSEPEASEQERQMDAIESTWHAEGDAAKEEPLQEPPLHEQFDLTDTPVEPLLAPPRPPTPSSEPKPSVVPRPASGSGQIVSSSDEVVVASGVTDVPDTPHEPRPVPEQKVILYEDDASAAAPAASTALN
ncbi:MAG TPA: hypothetical protein VJ694_00265 [Patescibacteria group bacterium]|nr:hypothetical protein [Patescibacteria group bacterium]